MDDVLRHRDDVEQVAMVWELDNAGAIALTTSLAAPHVHAPRSTRA